MSAPGRRTSTGAALAVVAMVLVLTTSAGCAGKRRGEPIVGPTPTRTASVERGRVVFEQHCYRCHGKGEGGLGPVINDKPLPRFLMRFQVRRGIGTMPGFPEEQISDDDLDALLDYIVDLRQQPRS
jgi:mono/diheme cytochrome c family protein